MTLVTLTPDPLTLHDPSDTRPPDIDNYCGGTKLHYGQTNSVVLQGLTIIYKLIIL